MLLFLSIIPFDKCPPRPECLGAFLFSLFAMFAPERFPI